AATQTQHRGTAPMSGPRTQAPAGAATPAGLATPVRPAAPARPADRRPDMAAALRPLLIDVGIPVGTYYLLRDAFGVSLWLALALSSIGPAGRALARPMAGRERKL